jgi:hypothetical protein
MQTAAFMTATSMRMRIRATRIREAGGMCARSDY